MPGYGFSGKPTATGWNPAHIARAWVVLMKRLGYSQFVSQGGDWGGAITNVMGEQAFKHRCQLFCNLLVMSGRLISLPPTPLYTSKTN
jgi:pimeloyl-ACP methyl ester carboxylesterase